MDIRVASRRKRKSQVTVEETATDHHNLFGVEDTIFCIEDRIYKSTKRAGKHAPQDPHSESIIANGGYMKVVYFSINLVPFLPGTSPVSFVSYSQ